MCTSFKEALARVGRGGAVVESKPFDRRVEGLNTDLAPRRDLGQVLNSPLSVALRRETPAHYRKRF